VTVNTIGTGIKGAVFIPANVHITGLKRYVFHPGKRLDPVNALPYRLPKPFCILHAACVLIQILLINGAFRLLCRIHTTPR
tara:strand:- start:108604 stop:108846 length:243 start_codon:yes stop_codon:yes gene_type:complete